MARSVPGIVFGLGDIRLESIVAEIIDNSLDEDAKNIELRFFECTSSKKNQDIGFAVFDDGNGFETCDELFDSFEIQQKDKQKSRKDTVFDFLIEDLAPVTYLAETLTFFDLNDFITEEKIRGSKLINDHLLVRHKRWSTPLSVFVLTIIAVSVSSFRRRGGMGINLAFGIITAFTFVFFDKFFSVMVSKSNLSPFLGAWIPNFVFLLLAFYFLKNAKK